MRDLILIAIYCFKSLIATKKKGAFSMESSMREKLRRSLIEHEGYRKHIYTDTVGKITVGIGFNLTDRDLPDWCINGLYEEDVNYFYNQLNNTFDWFKKLNDDRKIVLIDMCFMGFRNFCKFKKLIAALEKHDYKAAFDEMLSSKWATQVKTRAANLAQAMLTGVYHI